MAETAAMLFGWTLGSRRFRIPLLVVVVVVMMLPLVQGVYFTQLSYRSVIPASMSVGEEAMVMRVHSTPSVGHPSAVGADVECALERVHSSAGGGGGGGGGRGQDVRPVDWPFHVAPAQAEPGAFRILVALPLDVELRSDKVTYHLRVVCNDKTNGVRANSNVTINVFRDDEWRQPSERTSLCHHDVAFQLAENVRNVVLGTLWCSARQLCRQNEQRENCSLTVQGVKNNEFYDGYLVLEDSGQLTVERSFDRETVDQVTIAFLCSSSSSPSSSSSATGFSSSSRRSSSQQRRRFFCGATVNILDTDDQGPWFHKLGQGPLKYLETRMQLGEQKTTLLTTIATNDRDLWAANRYVASLEDDYDGRVSVGPPKRVLDNGHGVYFNTDVFVRGDLDLFRKDSFFFEVVVYIKDVSFIESFNADDNDTAICRIKVQSQSLWKPVAHHADSPIVFVSSSASVFSRVYYLGMSDDPYLLEATCDGDGDPNCDVTETAFAVTSREGIVYVSDARLLRDLVNRTTMIVVRNCSSSSSSSAFSSSSSSSSLLDQGGVCSVFLNLTVFVSADSRPTTSNESPEYGGCSAFYVQSSCVLAPGLGSPTGACVWRRNQPEAEALLTSYETCTPNLVTCPDGHCDELEMNVTELCPQDCTTNTPDGVGWADLNHGYAPPRGIFRAQGPCWCTGTQCRCGLSSGNLSANETLLPEMSVQDAIDGCGATCRLVLLVGLSSFLVLTLTFVIWKCFYSRRKVNRMRGHGSGIVPSDYTVAPGSIATDYTDYGTTGHLLDATRQNVLDVQDDPRWEFNRQYVRFESVLGEGEFGKVVKAKAWEIQGTPGYTTVAVKMLKECATAAEYRDLLSELNLLKLISHRNVIKLLGVCSRKGPLYVIVEFCEHGSLRCFLRRVRGRRERGGEGEGRGGGGEGGDGGGAGDDGPSESSAAAGDDDLATVTAQDLLSFSWQIAKGMDYLSGVKVVHRDLAARNVLLAAGMVVKISDFGLSRDIYEEDAYLKTSKGPLPVKWMAPESLYDQICTTKSDIWSYGVVLWEIYTLGANPYPGTPAERLYQLLKTGYRMTKPPSCSDELFAVMLRCWADDPSRRPPFDQLAETFEQFLTLDKDYLDLNVCENVLPEEQSMYASGSIGGGAGDDDAVRPAPLANGHYRVPRSTVIAPAAPAAPAGEVSLTVGHAIPPEFSGSGGKDSTAEKNSPLIPLRSSRNNERLSRDDDLKAPTTRNHENGGGFLMCLENRERAKKVEEVEEESNALLACSTNV